MSYVHTKKYNFDKLSKNEYKTLCNYDNGCVVELTEEIGKSPKFDKQVARYLKPKQAPKVINVEDPWGSCKITSSECSPYRMTFLKDRQYLTTAISNSSPERLNQRIHTVEQILTNRNNISSNGKLTQRVSQKTLNPQFKINNDVYYGACNGERVRIWDELSSTPDLYETMGHEFNHLKWFKNMENTLDRNTTGMSRKTINTAKKLILEEKEIENIPYLEQKMERLAFSEENKVKQKFFDMFDNIIKFFKE